MAVIASNDSWVMNAWGKVNGVKGDDIVRILAGFRGQGWTGWLTLVQLFLADTKTFFSKEYGWPAGMGDRK